MCNMDLLSKPNVRVFSIADGVSPFTASALGLFMPASWKYWTIDPLLDCENHSFRGELAHRMHMIKQRSEEFAVPNKSFTEQLSIVVACHSHAPLQELWDRIPSPKLGVVMPCCNKRWSFLIDSPLDCYEDFEVLSPMRRISLYYTSS